MVKTLQPEKRTGKGQDAPGGLGQIGLLNFVFRVCAGEAGCHAGGSPAGRNETVHDRKLNQGRSREAEPESRIQTELSGCNDSEPHRMSLERDNREPSRYLNGEGCHVPSSNSCAAAPELGGVSEGDRTGRADRVSRENSSGASATQPAGQGGEPTGQARAAGVVGVPRSSADPWDSKTDGERRRGTWVNACGHGEGPADGREAVATLFDRMATPPKVQKLQRALYRKAKAAPGYRFYSLYGELLRREVIETLYLLQMPVILVFQPGRWINAV